MNESRISFRNTGPQTPWSPLDSVETLPVVLRTTEQAILQHIKEDMRKIGEGSSFKMNDLSKKIFMK